jgi:hypothetical protein
MVMPEDKARLERKHRMLQLFVSEDGESLVRNFGGRGRFRQISDIESALRERPRGYLRLGAYRAGIPALAALAVVYVIAFVATAMLARLVVKSGVPTGTAASAGVVLVALGAWFCAKRQDPQRRLFLIVLLAGFLAGGWLTR